MMSREELIAHAWDLTSGEGNLSPKDHFVLLGAMKVVLPAEGHPLTIEANR